MSTVCNLIASYLENLTATNSICSNLGSTLTFGTNLYIGGAPATTIDTITITPYGGGVPDLDNYKYESHVQIQTKTKSRQKALNTQQAIIYKLHTNELGGRGKMFSIQSAPIIMDTTEGGEYMLCVSNFNIKHIKTT